MTLFKQFLVASTVLATVSFIGPVVLFFVDKGLAAQAFFVASWAAIACSVLLLTALVLFRFRGLWLVIPTVIALIWPIYVPVEFARSVDDCLKHHPHGHCLP